MQETVHAEYQEQAEALFNQTGTFFKSKTPMLWRVVGGKVVGAFAWTEHEGDVVQMHFVGAHKRWMTREFLRQAFTYPFDELRVKVILGFLPPERIYARDVAIKLGFKKCCVVPGVGLHMIAMTRADCKWLALPSKRS